MNLYNRLNEIENEYSLNKELRLKVICMDGDEVEGFYDGYTDALNNEPEITQLELRRNANYPGIVCILETNIRSIKVLK